MPITRTSGAGARRDVLLPDATMTPAEKARVAAALDRISGGRSPEKVREDNFERLSRPSEQVGDSYAGYTWKTEDLDAVMHQFGIGDAKALIKTAIAMRVGDTYLGRDVLEAAARKELEPFTKGFKWSPSLLADVMKKTGVADEGALLRTAMELDDGDKRLSKQELTRAAEVLLRIVKPNDVMGVYERLDEIATHPDCKVETLGVTDDLPVRAYTFEAKKQPPLLEVIVTGGVHGDEPCGMGAAMMLLDQLVADPRLREDVTFRVVPLVNPRGMAAGTRRTPENVDLNRNMVDVPNAPPEVEFMHEFFRRHDGELALDLHSGKAKRNGFWVLHKDSADLAKAAMTRMHERFPMLNGDTEPYDMRDTAGVATSSSTTTLKDLAHLDSARWAMTVEAPGSVGYLDQVIGENAIVHEAIKEAMLIKAREQLTGD
jgi:hypothetical protein